MNANAHRMLAVTMGTRNVNVVFRHDNFLSLLIYANGMAGVWRKCDRESSLDIPFPPGWPFSDSRSARDLRADTGIAEVAPLEGPAGFDPSLWLPWGLSFPNLPNASRKNGFA